MAQKNSKTLFPSFFGAGFESAFHRKQGGERVDSIAATKHDVFLREDYQRIAEAGLLVTRENIRWHLFEPEPGRYEPEELLRTVRASGEAGITCIWDLFHYGWPDGLDFWSGEMVERAGAYAGEVARLLKDAGIERPFLAPANEVNYFSWAGGDKGMMNPFAEDRAPEMKQQLVRCVTAMCRAIRGILPEARLVHTEPIIYLVPDRPEDQAEAEERNQGIYESWDQIAGRAMPELGGDESFLDLLGVNYYGNNQLVLDGPPLDPDDPRRRPLSSLLQEIWKRYNRPLIITETAEAGDKRAPWLAHIADECDRAIREGVPVEGITLYPILDFPDWQSSEPMLMGLWGAADADGERPIHQPLLDELRRQQTALLGSGSSSRQEPEQQNKSEEKQPMNVTEFREKDTGAAGYLVIIGGHEDRECRKIILQEVAQIVRKRARPAADKNEPAGKIVVTTAASHEPEGYFEQYDKAFRDLGVADVVELSIADRAEANDPEKAASLDGADGLFFTGGDQLKITSQLGDTLVLWRLREIYEQGAVIAGTSAGASALCDTMLVRGTSQSTYRMGDLHMAPGLGFIRGVIIDQHFAERGRMGRLLGAVGHNPQELGIGIDEDTAIVVEADHTFYVRGSGAVYVVDGDGISYSNIADKQEDVLSLHDVKLHVLSDGDRFNLLTRRPAKK